MTSIVVLLVDIYITSVTMSGEQENITSNLRYETVLAEVHPVPTVPATIPVSFPIMESMEVQHMNDQFPVLLRNSILNEVLMQLPALFEQFLDQNDRSYISTPGSATATQKNEFVELQRDMEEVKKKNKAWDNKINGYDKKLKTWTDTVKALDNDVTELKAENEKCAKDIKRTEKSVTNKMKEISSMQKKLEKTLEDMDKSRLKLTESIDSLKTIDGKKIIEIEGSQDFVSSQYDNILKNNNDMKEDITQLAKQVERNSMKTEQNAGYSRRDCLEFGGIPKNIGFDGKEDCKKMIKDICKVLNLSLRDDAISTAHRLKQHPSKTGPPSIIAKFNLRDDRNDVFALRGILKTTKINILGITKLFINESLTPEKKKILYECKKYAREHYDRFGKIYVWSFKGDVYVRQSLENAPRFQINYYNDLVQFGKKCVNCVNLKNDVLKTRDQAASNGAGR